MAGNLPGEPQQLSEREREILRLVASGLSNQQIAHHLGISVNTVKVHLRNVFSKIGAASRTEASMYAVRAGLVQLDTNQVVANTSFPPSPAIQAASSEEAAQITGEPNGSAYPQDALSHPGAEDAAPSAPATPMAHAGPHPQRHPGLTRTWPVMLLAIGLIALFAGGLLWRWRSLSAQATPAPAVARWRVLGDMPIPRAAFASATFDGRIYIIGGENQNGVLGSVLRYDPRFNTWTELSAKPLPVADVQAAVLGGKVYVPGGRTTTASSGITDRFERYDPRTDEWETLPELPAPRSGYALAALDGKLYLLGGWDGNRFCADVFVFDPERNRWQTGPTMPVARAFAAAAVLEDRIYIMGGENETGHLAIHDMYTPGLEQAWTRRARLPEPRSRMDAVAVLSSIVVVGGAEAVPVRYNAPADSWEALEPPPQPIGLQAGAVLVEGALYSLGGRLDTTYTATVQRFQAIYTQFLPQQVRE